MLESAINISEGKNRILLDRLPSLSAACFLDIHSDPYHNRSVLTLAGDDTALMATIQNVVLVSLENIDISKHSGVHPRLGAIDVVPFVPLDSHRHPTRDEAAFSRAIEARDQLCEWLGTLGIPCFLYGNGHSLPEIRKDAFTKITPDNGLRLPHPTAGACCVGARGALIAYNIWLDTAELAVAKYIAKSLRSDQLRTLGFMVGDMTQVSFNIVDTTAIKIDNLYDAVEKLALSKGVAISRAELVGLLPAECLATIPPNRYEQLDIGPERTVEGRITMLQR